ncbi:MAG TPA: glycosyltransferase family 4 protein [Rhodanobacteraceae bacterium]|nr:glycosyltransferase family 4 protein [Rhodanobacteraceae bacterium]
MRIAFLCKRRYMSKDVILDRYARLYEIPFQLARLGHDVRGFCLSYQNAEEGEWQHHATPGSLHWESRSLGRLYLPGLASYPHKLLQRLHAFAPDVLIGASDIPHAALTAWLSKRLRVPYAIDLYDNFEGFGQARLPGMVRTLRRAVRHADLVTTTSELLRELVVDVYGARGEVVAMPSTIDKSMFHPRDRLACRRSLGLPESARLIGTAGGLLANRGIGVLYEAWKIIESRHEDVHLVLAGPVDDALPPPSGARVHYLGMLPHARTAELFAALDVGVIYLADTPFGRYCFPQKAYEMLACELPVVGADLGAMPHLLASTPEALYHAEDATDLVRAIQHQLQQAAPPTIPVQDWAEVISQYERKIAELVESDG